MKLKIFTFVYDETRGVFDDSEMTSFLELREVVEVREHFFNHGPQKVWALMVTYRELPSHRWPRASGGKRKDNHKLDAASRTIFDALRKWRNELAQSQGKPPYVILNNKQLAVLSTERPSTIEGLSRVKGIGEARIKNYGKELLVVIEAAQGEVFRQKDEKKSENQVEEIEEIS